MLGVAVQDGRIKAARSDHMGCWNARRASKPSADEWLWIPATYQRVREEREDIVVRIVTVNKIRKSAHLSSIVVTFRLLVLVECTFYDVIYTQQRSMESIYLV